jgi:hypothetical protein
VTQNVLSWSDDEASPCGSFHVMTPLITSPDVEPIYALSQCSCTTVRPRVRRLNVRRPVQVPLTRTRIEACAGRYRTANRWSPPVSCSMTNRLSLPAMGRHVACTDAPFVLSMSMLAGSTGACIPLATFSQSIIRTCPDADATGTSWPQMRNSCDVSTT